MADKTYSVDEFARVIKDKYPAYEDRDNKVLVDAYIKKHPVYKDRVNFEQSFVSKAKDYLKAPMEAAWGAMPKPEAASSATEAIGHDLQSLANVPETPIGRAITDGLISHDTASSWAESVGRAHPNSPTAQYLTAAMATGLEMIAPADIILGGVAAGAKYSKLAKEYEATMKEMGDIGSYGPKAFDISKAPAEEASIEALRGKFEPVAVSEKAKPKVLGIKKGEKQAKIPTGKEWAGAEKAEDIGMKQQALMPKKQFKPIDTTPKPVKTVEDHVDNIAREEATKALTETGTANDAKAIENLNKAGVKADVSHIEPIPTAPSPLEMFTSNIKKAYDDGMNFMVRSLDGGLRRQGVYGHWMANGLKKVRNASDIRTAGSINDIMPHLKKLSKAETEQLVDALDKGAEITTPNVQSAYDIIKRKFNEIAKDAQDVGLTIKSKTSTGEVLINPWTPRENFYPHVHDFAKMISSDFYREKIIAHLVNTRQAKNKLAAADALNQYMRRNMQRRVGNLEFSRTLDLPDFDRNPVSAIGKYLKNSYHRIEEAKTFGPADEKAKTAIDKIFAMGGNAEYAREAFDRATKIKRDEITGRQFMGFMRNLSIYTKMGLSAITNASQPVQAMAVTDMSAFAKGIHASLSEAGREFALKSGVILDTAMENVMRDTAGGSLSGSKYLEMVGFSKVEKFNRIVSANTGKEFFLDLFDKAKKTPGNKEYQRELLKLGFHPKQLLSKMAPSEDDIIKAARSVVERTQFLTDPQDMPLFYSSPWGKFAMQLKTFAYKQTEFIYNELLKEATAGNIKPVVRYLTGGAIAGEVTQDIKSVIKNKDRDEKGFKRVLANVSSIGGLGILSDIVYNVSGTTPKLGMVVAPASFSPIGDVLAAGVDVSKGELKKAYRHVAPDVPFIGPFLSGLAKENKIATRTLRK